MSSTASEVSKTVKGSPYKDNVVKNRNSARLRTATNLTRCPSIPFSSPAGIVLGKKSNMMTDDSQQERLERVERHVTAPALCSAPPPKWMSKISNSERWSVTFKQSHRDRLTKNSYVHHYNFGNFSGKPGNHQSFIFKEGG